MPGTVDPSSLSVVIVIVIGILGLCGYVGCGAGVMVWVACVWVWCMVCVWVRWLVDVAGCFRTATVIASRLRE